MDLIRAKWSAAVAAARQEMQQDLIVAAANEDASRAELMACLEQLLRTTISHLAEAVAEQMKDRYVYLASTAQNSLKNKVFLLTSSSKDNQPVYGAFWALVNKQHGLKLLETGEASIRLGRWSGRHKLAAANVAAADVAASSAALVADIAEVQRVKERLEMFAACQPTAMKAAAEAMAALEAAVPAGDGGAGGVEGGAGRGTAGAVGFSGGEEEAVGAGAPLAGPVCASGAAAVAANAAPRAVAAPAGGAAGGGAEADLQVSKDYV